MQHEQTIPGPVVIGGVGGSGTRVVSEMMIALDYYMGSYLNEALDNLWFLVFFNQPEWYFENAANNPAEIDRVLSFFERAMREGLKPTPKNFMLIMSRYLSFSKYINLNRPVSIRHDKSGQRRIQHGLSLNWQRFVAMLGMLHAPRPSPDRYRGWGWKNPISQIYLPYILERFGDDMKYIQVIRHGLDMAYSRNQGQQYRWAKHFNVPALSASSDEISPNMSLQYWIEANRQTIALASERLGDRFLIIRFDDMVTNPQKTVDELLAFLDIETIDQDLKAKLIAMPRAPRSLWRYKQHDLSIFTAEEIEAVRALGFAVESEQL